MLSIGVLQSSAQAGTYYAQDNYYTKDAQVGGSDAGAGLGGSSRWDGRGAKGLGLTGAVDQGQFERLLNGELPNGVVLKRGQQGKHQPGWDLTFSAPKSVSLMALVAGDSRVIEAHNLAVSEALHYLEATTAQAGGILLSTNRVDRTGMTQPERSLEKPERSNPRAGCCGSRG